MIAGLIPATGPAPLGPNVTSAQARKAFAEAGLAHLPVCSDEGIFLGMLSLAMLRPRMASIGSLLPSLEAVRVGPEASLFDVASLMHLHRLTALPIVSGEGKLMNLLTSSDVLGQVAALSAITTRGGVIVLSVGLYDYSLAEIARLVEANDVKILSTLLSNPDEAMNLEVTLKLNTTDLNAVISTLHRFNYNVTSYSSQGATDDYYQERYEALLAYLRV